MCPSVENPDLVYQQTGYSQSPTHSRPAECGSKYTIQARPGNSNRVISPSRGLPGNVQQVAPTSNRPLLPSCDKDPQDWAVDVLSLPWEGLVPYAFPPAAILGKVVEELQDYPCRRIILIAPGWPYMPWFWGSGLVQPNPTKPAQPAHTTIQSDSTQESVKPKSTCVAPRASAIKEQDFSEAVAA